MNPDLIDKSLVKAIVEASERWDAQHNRTVRVGLQDAIRIAKALQRDGWHK